MGRKQDVWHDELHKITTSLDRLALDTDEVVRSVILDRLNRPTDLFLRKRNWLCNSSSQEDRLNALIRGHGDKCVALLSCAHVMSRSTIRSLLATPIELNVDLANDSSMSRYTGLIAGIHLVNSNAVSQTEAKRARALIRLLEKKPDTFLRGLRNFFSGGDPVLLYDLFPPGSLDSLVHRLCLSFATQLEIMREQCSWAAAHRAVGDLKSSFGISPALDALINTSIRCVGAWARWRPAKPRIHSQEKLGAMHKAEISEILVLNGPDFTYGRCRTFADALLYQARFRNINYIVHGGFAVWLSADTRIDSRALVEGILNFPSGGRLFMPGAMETFVYLCLRHAVNLNTLRILEEAAALRDPKVYESLSIIFCSASSTIRTSGVMCLLGIVHTNGNHALLECLSGYLVDIVQEDFRDMQMRLYDLIVDPIRRNPQPAAVQVQAFGQSISNIPSLRSTPDQYSQTILNDWPSAAEVDALFQLRAEVERDRINGVEALLDQYCLFRHAGRGTLDEVSRRAVTALQWHWQEGPHVPRQTLAMSIISCTSLTLDVRAECLLRLRGMDDDPLREMDTIIYSSTEMACVLLARLICAKRFARHREQSCWKDVLWSLMEIHGDTLLDFTSEKMEVQIWFEWLSHLRKIFNVREGSESLGQLVLDHRLHSWSQIVGARYLVVLIRLEGESSKRSLVQASLRGWEHQEPIRRVLDFFVDEGERDPQHPLIEAIDGLRLEGHENDGQVWEMLAALAQTDY